MIIGETGYMIVETKYSNGGHLFDDVTIVKDKLQAFFKAKEIRKNSDLGVRFFRVELLDLNQLERDMNDAINALNF